MKAFAFFLHRRASPPPFTAERNVDADFAPFACISPGLFPDGSALSGENGTRSVRFQVSSELKMSPFAQSFFKKNGSDVKVLQGRCLPVYVCNSLISSDLRGWGEAVKAFY